MKLKTLKEQLNELPSLKDQLVKVIGEENYNSLIEEGYEEGTYTEIIRKYHKYGYRALVKQYYTTSELRCRTYILPGTIITVVNVDGTKGIDGEVKDFINDFTDDWGFVEAYNGIGKILEAYN